MSESRLVLVTGATGKQGGAVVEALLARGHQVRALTRSAASPAANRLRQQGVEIAVSDFTGFDGGTTESAVAGLRIERPLHLVRRKGRRDGPALQAFCAVLREMTAVQFG
jgi:nucleoside-diphosphate-sugar epimerase